MRPFREQNKTVIGFVGLASTIALLAGAFNIGAILGGEEYQAEFSEAAGLAPEDEVRVAGVKVGKVLSVELDGPKVVVAFRVSDARLGEQSRADIRIKTLLGRKFLMLTPEGDTQLEEGGTIPIAQTSAPFEITNAFGDLASTAEAIDTGQLAEAFTVLADTFRDTPDDVQASLEGLSRLSNTIASRDQQLGELLDRSRGVSQVLAERDDDLTAFFADSSLVFQELTARREEISRLLDTTVALSEQIVGLVRENRATLGPTLDRLEDVVFLLRENQGNLDQSIQRLAPFVRIFENNLGNGRWFDTIVENLTTPTLCPGSFGNGEQIECDVVPIGGS